MSMIHISGPTSTSKLTNVDDSMVQQNATDLKLKSVSWMEGVCILDEEKKQHRKTKEIKVGDDGYWTLIEGSYEVVFDSIITIGPDEAGFVITRSTLNRNGIFVTSGNYDSGFSGAMAGCLHVSGGTLKIKPGTRVGQFLCFKAEALSQYAGDYGFNADGTPKAMEAKYHA